MPGSDNFTKLLLHCDGANASTTFTDASLAVHGNATVVADAQVSTTAPKFGTGALLLDGVGDYISYADHADWDVFSSNTSSRTIDCWIKKAALGTFHGIIGHYQDGSNYWYLRHDDSNRLEFLMDNVTIMQTAGNIINDTTTWHHVALIKVAQLYGLYVDGTQVEYGTTADTVTATASLCIGARDTGVTNPYNGRIDELRIQNSNYFGALPAVDNSDTITVPTVAYSLNPKGGLAIGAPYIL